MARLTPGRSATAPSKVNRVLVLEFTIEPFVEGHPGPHVLSAVAAAEALGVTVEFGPFGSTCTVPSERVADVTGAVVAAAFAHGATHVTLHAERLDDTGGDDAGGDPS